jgi:hypothetical protein
VRAKDLELRKVRLEVARFRTSHTRVRDRRVQRNDVFNCEIGRRAARKWVQAPTAHQAVRVLTENLDIAIHTGATNAVYTPRQRCPVPLSAAEKRVAFAGRKAEVLAGSAV